MAGSDWMDRALCRLYPPEQWFPKQGKTGARAIKVCRLCSVRRDCWDHAVSLGEEYGIWGGLRPGRKRDGTEPSDGE